MKHNFVCIRCGYETSYKSSMHNHFYKKKKPCPMVKNALELTEEIKRHILENFVYLLPVNTASINNTINTFNTVNNFISGLDPIDKITKYTNHKNIDLIDFEDKVEHKYERRVKRLTEGKFHCGFELSSDDFFEIINEISTICNTGTFDEFNILYDNKINRVKLYDRGMWEEMLLNNGIRRILITIQDYYLNSYELYLIRKLCNPNVNTFDKQQIQELLIEYYKFIGSFDVVSCIKDMNDSEILNYEDMSENFEIHDKYDKLFKNTRDNLKRSDINRVKKEVVEILKRNSIKNIEEMNKRVLDLFQVDEGFKSKIVISSS